MNQGKQTKKGRSEYAIMLKTTELRYPSKPSIQKSKLKRQDQEGDHGMWLVERICVILSFLIFIITFPIAVFFVFKIVAQFERAVIFRLGRLRAGGARGPGLFFVLPCIDIYTNVDLRTVSVDIAPQEVLTSDSCTVFVDAVIFYKVVDPLKAVININNYKGATMMLAATTLRNVLGQKSLTDILSEREVISSDLEGNLAALTKKWGIAVEKVEIKDVSLPASMQRAMAAEAEATREAKAKVIGADGELQASKAIKAASDIISESPAALQLRYLQTLANIATEQESTVLFPIPIDISMPMEISEDTGPISAFGVNEVINEILSKVIVSQN